MYLVILEVKPIAFTAYIVYYVAAGCKDFREFLFEPSDSRFHGLVGERDFTVVLKRGLDSGEAYDGPCGG